MGLFNFVTRVGNKIANGIHSVAVVGKKVTGAVDRVGHKIASTGKNVLSVVERIPGVGSALAPLTGLARSGIGLVQNIADGAAVANQMISAGDDLVRRGQNALNTRDIAGAKSVMRDASKFGGSSAAQIQRASQVLGQAKSLSGMAGGAVGESKANIMKNVVQAREQARASISNF